MRIETPWASIADHSGFHGPRDVGPWNGTLRIDGRWLEVTIVRDDREVCGETDPVRWVQCRLPKHHDGPHIPFSEEAILRHGPFAIAAMRSSSAPEHHTGSMLYDLM